MKLSLALLTSLLFLQSYSAQGNATNGAVHEDKVINTEKDHHCKNNEDVVFKCLIKHKKLSVCEIESNRVSYRYGELKQVEIVIDSDVVTASTSFSGGAESHLIFSKGRYKYVFFDYIGNGEWIDVDEGIREKLELGGVIVVKDDKQIARLECTHFLPENSFARRNFNGSKKVEFNYFN